MEDFAYTIDDDNLKETVLDELKRNHPFRRFKDIVESSEYADKWYKFKEKREKDYIKKELESELRSDDDR